MKLQDLENKLFGYKTYIFDCDGVLLDSNRVKTQAFHEAALVYGGEVAQDFAAYHRAHGGISRQKKFEHLFLKMLGYAELPQDLYTKALDDYARLVAKGLMECEVLPGVQTFLEALPKESKRFVVSGGAEEEVRWVLKAKNLAHYFDGIYGNPIDKMDLVANLELKEGDYPAIFFGDARYDHQVASHFGLDFLFLSGVSDFDDWPAYTDEHNITVVKGFDNLIKYSADQQNGAQKCRNTLSSQGRGLLFGFPFSIQRPSRYTGSTVGPFVVKELVKLTGTQVILVSSSAEAYESEAGVIPIHHKIANWDSASKSKNSLSLDNLSKYSSMLPALQEMVERTPHARLALVAVPSYQTGTTLRKFVWNKLAFWHFCIFGEEVHFYINSNVPHLADDFACYQLCRIHGVPTAFPYRLPLVPGVLARLYIPESLYNHDQVYGREGNLLSYDRDQEYGDLLPSDLQHVYDQAVDGEHTLSSLGKQAVKDQGREPPQQFTPPALEQPFWQNIRNNLMRRFTPQAFLSAWSAYQVAQSNRNKYKKLARAVVPDYGPYIYYALHMQPEASSSPLGGGFSDQLRAIRFLAQHLPQGWQLVVKEHPHQKLEERPVDFYEDILACPKVTLVSMEMSSDDLQAKALAIATLTGTAALEAWLKGRPALVLGHILFQSAPGIYKIRTDEDLQAAYQALEQGVIHTKDDIYHYLQYLAQASFPGHLDAYIDPCIPDYQLDPEENEKEIAYRLAKAIQTQQAAREGLA